MSACLCVLSLSFLPTLTAVPAEMFICLLIVSPSLRQLLPLQVLLCQHFVRDIPELTTNDKLIIEAPLRFQKKLYSKKKLKGF